MNKKLIISLSTIAAIAIIAIGATTAYFSNTETSSGNTFIAGAIDLKIDNTCHYNGATCVCDPQNPANCRWQTCPPGSPSCQAPGESCSCTWRLTDLDGELFFNFLDVKPGDDGEDTISLHVDSNPAWICAEVSNVTQMENGCNLPESMVDLTCEENATGTGELWENLRFSIWMDDNCDNILNGDETYLVENAGASDIKWPIADSQTGGEPIEDACIGVSWSVPDGVGNIIQGDSVTGDITFYAYQARNNNNFLCNPPVNYCGDGKVGGTEQCEWPGDINCSYCTQSTSQCVGPKLQIRDAYGDCNGTCGCAYDPWSDPVCDVQTCGAECAVDADCDDSDPATTDTCDSDCGCQHIDEIVCGDGNIDEGEQCDDGDVVPLDGCSATCTLEPTITIHKDVVNNDVGTKTPGNFQMTIDGNNAAQDTAIYVSVGSHTISEANTFGYDKTYSVNCPNGVVNLGDNEDITCTVTNTMPYGTITVTKTVTNNDGGLLTVGNFTLKIDGITVASGVAKNVAVGAHNVSEVGQFGYLATISGDCNSSGDVTVAAGGSKSCTINNNDIAPSITLVKNVVGGSALPDDFDLSIDGAIKTSGSSNPVTANTAHVIDEEVMVSGYGFTSLTGSSYLGVSCPAALEGTITLLPGDVVTCTITNTKP